MQWVDIKPPVCPAAVIFSLFSSPMNKIENNYTLGRKA
jgi:hypothetical protein